jgi:hypothetical protein
MNMAKIKWPRWVKDNTAEKSGGTLVIIGYPRPPKEPAKKPWKPPAWAKNKTPSEP